MRTRRALNVAKPANGIVLSEANGALTGVIRSWQYSDSTTASDPGDGYFRFDDPDPENGANIYISDLDGQDGDLGGLLANIGVGTKVLIKSANAPAQWIIIELGTNTDNTGWHSIAYTVIAGAPDFLADETCAFEIGFAGAQGPAGTGDVIAKSGTYTTTADDDRALITCDASSSDFTISLLAAATAGDGALLGFKKIDSTTNVVTIDPDGSETIDGAATFTLDKQYETVWLKCDGSNWYVIDYYRENSRNAREILIANRTYYVDPTDGDDSNDGLSAGSGGAFATLQNAWNVTAGLDLNNYTVTIQLADDAYGTLTVSTAPIGTGSVVIQGNSGTPSNVTLTGTNPLSVAVACAVPITLKDLKLVASAGSCIRNAAVAQVYINNIDFGSASQRHIHTTTAGAIVETSGNYTISGNAQRHWYSSLGGKIIATGRTITLSGTPAFSQQFANSENLGMINCFGNTFSGSATGTRYSATYNGFIGTNGGGASYLPGDAAGSTANGGQYA